MTLVVPISVWLERRAADTQLDSDTLLALLRSGEKYDDKPLTNSRGIIHSVRIYGNRASYMAWLASKMDFKMNLRRCGCGNFGIKKDNGRAFICGDCGVKDRRYERSLLAISERKERMAFDEQKLNGELIED